MKHWIILMLPKNFFENLDPHAKFCVGIDNLYFFSKIKSAQVGETIAPTPNFGVGEESPNFLEHIALCAR